VEIHGLGGADFERAVDRFRSGGAVLYRGMALRLVRAELECRVPWSEPAAALTDRRALDALLRARFRLGALLASAPPLEAVVGNRKPRLILVDDRAGEDAPAAVPAELYELRGDRLRRIAPPAAG
jgi:hypothetical protein